MKHALIRLLFSLLGNSYTKQYPIPAIFGDKQNHDSRKKQWEQALVRLYKDKALLDFLFYLCETDKENVFKGKIDRNLALGSRIRTLFIVYSAHKEHLKVQQQRTDSKREQADIQEDIESIHELYTGATSVKT